MSKIKEIVIVSREHQIDGGAVGYKPENIEDYPASFGEKALSFSFIMDSFRKIMGRTLTMIDASIVEKQQNKAMKDIIRGIFSEEMDFASEMAFDQKEIDKMIEDATEHMEDGDYKTVTVEEALGV